MHHDIVKRYIELQALMLAPIAPHFAEYLWLELLKKPETIQNALWPKVPDTVPALTSAREYVKATSSNITSAEGTQLKKIAKGKNVDFDPNKSKLHSQLIISLSLTLHRQEGHHLRCHVLP